MVGDTCEKCGFKPKRPANKLYFSAMFDRTLCIDGVACLRRIDRQRPPDPTEFMDDDEIAAHNEAMANDPQYRDAIHYERN